MKAVSSDQIRAQLQQREQGKINLLAEEANLLRQRDEAESGLTQIRVRIAMEEGARQQAEMLLGFAVEMEAEKVATDGAPASAGEG